MAARVEISVPVDNSRLINDAIRDGIKAAIGKACLDTEAHAKTLVPVDTGNLKNSIQSDLAGLGSLEGEVGTNVEYALYVEFGTHKAPAQPYMTPAAEHVAASFSEVVARLIDSRLP